MATRANIELYDRWEDVNPAGQPITEQRKGVLLYHHWDGHPCWMGPELERLLEEVKAYLDRIGRSYWWDSQRVGALMVLFSGDRESSCGTPSFQPCVELHGDIEYLWRIYLGLGEGTYEIECYRVSWDCERDEVEHLEKVNWKEVVEPGVESEPERCA